MTKINKATWKENARSYFTAAFSTALVAMILTTIPATANASLESAFNRMTDGYGQREQSFRTATRRGYTGGSYRIRIPQKKVNLVNVDPPRFQAGCNGIDMHFGGLDFISGDEIKELLTSIAKATPYVAIQMAMNKLCATCASTIDEAVKMIQEAVAISIDSCEAATALVGAAADIVEGEGIKQAGCTMTNAASHSWMSAKKKQCDEAGMRDTIKDLTSTKSGREQMANVFGNQTWIALQAMGLAPEKAGSSDSNPDVRIAYLLMSYMGTVIRPKEDEKDDDGKPEEPRVYGSTFGDEGTADFMNLMLCGDGGKVNVSGSAGQVKENIIEAVNEFCQSVHEAVKKDDMLFYSCKDEEFKDCLVLDYFDNKKEGLIERGVMQMLAEEIGSMVDLVSEGKPLTNKQKSLIANSPFPLYRAINVAAVHPDLARQLLEAHIMPLSYMIANEMINNVIKEGVARYTHAGHSLPVELHKSMVESLGKLQRFMNDMHFQRLNLFSETVNTIMTRVNQINQATLSSAMALGITGADFGSDIANGL